MDLGYACAMLMNVSSAPPEEEVVEVPKLWWGNADILASVAYLAGLGEGPSGLSHEVLDR